MPSERLEREPRSKLSDSGPGVSAAVQDLAEISVYPGAGIGIAVTVEGIEHVVADVQFESAIGAEREILVDADVFGGQAEAADIGKVGRGISEFAVGRIHEARGVEVRAANLAVEAATVNIAARNQVGIHIVHARVPIG